MDKRFLIEISLLEVFIICFLILGQAPLKTYLLILVPFILLGSYKLGELSKKESK